MEEDRNCRKVVSVAADRPAGAAGHVPKKLDELSDDVLLFLLSFCDLQSLGRLCRVSKRFFCLVHKDCVWVRVKRRLTVVGCYQNRTKQRHPLSPRQQCRIALNWKKGICRDSRLVHHSEKQLPWIQWDGDLLWISYTSAISCYQPKRNGHLKKLSSKTLRGGHQDDVCRFTCKDGIIVSGTRAGSIDVFDTRSSEKLSHYSRCHVGDVQSVDFHSEVMISGSRDGSVKVWRMGRKQSEALLHTITIGDRVWSLAFHPNGQLAAVGNAGIGLNEPLQLWDINRLSLLGALGTQYKRGAGVLDIQFENSNTLLSCGYDTYIRLWDMRCPYTKSVMCWEEPYDSAVYCIQSDYSNTFLTGSSRHGIIHLWDKRKITPVQMYYTGRTASPVYSLAFDHSHLYSALDRGINMLDFSISMPA